VQGKPRERDRRERGGGHKEFLSHYQRHFFFLVRVKQKGNKRKLKSLIRGESETYFFRVFSYQDKRRWGGGVGAKRGERGGKKRGTSKWSFWIEKEVLFRELAGPGKRKGAIEPLQRETRAMHLKPKSGKKNRVETCHWGNATLA